MKPYIVLCLWILASIKASAQLCPPLCIGEDEQSSCCNEIISTDPESPINTERPEYKNRFDWRSRTLTTFHPPSYETGAGSLVLRNPFWNDTEPHLQHISFYGLPTHIPRDPTNLDFHPEDGWELIHRHLGYELDEIQPVDPFYQRIGPYIILYNKYTSTLRLIASFDFEPNDQIMAQLSFIEDLSLKKSALLSQHNGVGIALDKNTVITRVGRAVPFSAGRGFFVADFPMSYDPCVCSYPSELQFNFSTINIGYMQLDGRFVATSVPLTGSGAWPLLNSNDFMLAVHRDQNFSINGGALTYSNIDALANKYKTPPGINPMDQLLIDGFAAILKEGASGLDSWLNGVITPHVRKFLANAIDLSKENQEKVKVGLGLFSSGADLLIDNITPNKHGGAPNIHFIEGEMSLSGTVTNEIDLNNGSILLKNPGSLKSNSPDVHWTNYPSYNEPLGVFALLKTPKVIVDIRQPDNFPPQGPYPFKLRLKLAEELKYYFNSSAEVNIDKTKMAVAFELYYPDNIGKNSFGAFDRLLSAKAPTTIATNSFPISCFQSNSHELIDSASDMSMQGLHVGLNGKLYIKIIIECIFKQNRYGKINKSLMVFKYPVEISELSQDLFQSEVLSTSSCPLMLNINLPTTYTTNSTQQVWNNVQVSNKIASVLGTSTTIRAGSSIVLLEGAIIGSDISLTIGLPANCSSTISPVCDSEVKNFCQSSEYKANESIAKTDHTRNNRLPHNKSTSFLSSRIYPNPANEEFYITISDKDFLELEEIQLLDNTGRKIFITQKTLESDGSKVITIQTKSVKPGLYLCKIVSKTGLSKTEKIILFQ